MLDTLVHNRRGEVGLAATAGTGEDQPAFGVGGVITGGMVSPGKLLLAVPVGTPALGNQVFKGKARQRAKVGVLLKAGLAFSLFLVDDTGTGDNTAIVRPPARQARIDNPGALADGAFRTAFDGRLRLGVSAGPCARIFL